MKRRNYCPMKTLFKYLAGGTAVVVASSILALTALASGEKVSVCHQTDSVQNPVRVIKVSVQALGAHLSHGDSLANVDGSCEVPGPVSG